MARSMTGYGRGEAVLYERKIVIEIKSVNHRYNDVTIKLPRALQASEEAIKKRIMRDLSRGKADVYVTLDSMAQNDVKISLNQALAGSYMKELTQMRTAFGVKGEIDLALLTSFPDIFTIEKAAYDEEALRQTNEAIACALEQALAMFVDMREREGRALADDILKKSQTIQGLAGQVAERAPLVAEDYRTRLRAKLEEALQGVQYDEQRLLTEVLLFTDRACIDEELTRLDSHMNQLCRILEEKNAAIGRKLDFLLQEINREVNTIGSKSNDLTITQTVVEMKSELEKIREQAQNIE